MDVAAPASGWSSFSFSVPFPEWERLPESICDSLTRIFQIRPLQVNRSVEPASHSSSYPTVSSGQDQGQWVQRPWLLSVQFGRWRLHHWEPAQPCVPLPPSREMKHLWDRRLESNRQLWIKLWLAGPAPHLTHADFPGRCSERDPHLGEGTHFPGAVYAAAQSVQYVTCLPKSPRLTSPDRQHAPQSNRRLLLLNLLEDSTAHAALQLPFRKFFAPCLPLCNHDISPGLRFILPKRTHNIPYTDLHWCVAKQKSPPTSWPAFASTFILHHGH